MKSNGKAEDGGESPRSLEHGSPGKEETWKARPPLRPAAAPGRYQGRYQAPFHGRHTGCNGEDRALELCPSVQLYPGRQRQLPKVSLPGLCESAIRALHEENLSRLEEALARAAEEPIAAGVLGETACPRPLSSGPAAVNAASALHLTESVFGRIAALSGNPDLSQAVGAISRRLRPIRLAEFRNADDVPGRIEELRLMVSLRDRQALIHALSAYHAWRLYFLPNLMIVMARERKEAAGALPYQRLPRRRTPGRAG